MMLVLFRILYVFMAFVLPVVLHAQTSLPESNNATNAAPFKLRQIPQAEVDSLKRLSEWQFEEKTEPDWRDTFRQWLTEKLGWLFFHLGDWWKVLGYLLLIVVVVMILFKFLKLDVTNIFTPAALSLKRKTAEEEELPETDLRALLDQAIRAQDHRRCIRLQYLLALRKLIDLGFVTPQYRKTNTDYIYELPKGSTLQQNFAAMTRVFELVWYGDYPANEQMMQTATRTFGEFEVSLMQAAHH